MGTARRCSGLRVCLAAENRRLAARLNTGFFTTFMPTPMGWMGMSFAPGSTSDLDFSETGRRENIRRIGEVDPAVLRCRPDRPDHVYQPISGRPGLCSFAHPRTGLYRDLRALPAGGVRDPRSQGALSPCRGRAWSPILPASIRPTKSPSPQSWSWTARRPASQIARRQSLNS